MYMLSKMAHPPATCNILSDKTDKSSFKSDADDLGKVVNISKLLAQLLNAKVVLEKLDKPLIKSSCRLPIAKGILPNPDLDDEKDVTLETNRKDYCHRYCDHCKKIVIDRIKDPIMKNCSDCKTAMTYLCTKCNVKHYKRYTFLKFHRARCNGNVDSSESNTEDTNTADPLERIDDIDQNESNNEDTSVADVSLVLDEDQFTVKQIQDGNLSEKYNRYCSECDVLVTSRDSRCNKCDKLLEFACKKCDAKYKFSSSIMYHLRNQCYPANEYQCTNCVYTVTDLATMRKHIKNKHTERRLLKCKLCSFDTKYKQSLKGHMKKFHRGKMIKRTDEVDKTEMNIKDTTTAGGSMDSSLALNKDQSAVKPTRTENFMDKYDRYCSKCDVVTTKHYISRCKKCDKYLKFICKKCNAKFAYNQGMLYHLRSQCYPTSEHKCTLCNYKTNNWALFRKHRNRVHTDRPKFKCALCPYEAKRKDHLKQHIIKQVHHKRST